VLCLAISAATEYVNEKAMHRPAVEAGVSGDQGWVDGFVGIRFMTVRTDK